MIRNRTVTAAMMLAATLGLTACASDVTQPRVQTDVSATFSHVFADTQHLLGRHTTAQNASSACKHNGGVKQNIGSGPWVCMITFTAPGSRTRVTDKYSVSVDNTDCYVATNGELAQNPNITTAAGKQIVDPLYQFDGCIDPYN